MPDRVEGSGTFRGLFEIGAVKLLPIRFDENGAQVPMRGDIINENICCRSSSGIGREILLKVFPRLNPVDILSLQELLVDLPNYRFIYVHGADLLGGNDMGIGRMIEYGGQVVVSATRPQDDDPVLLLK